MKHYIVHLLVPQETWIAASSHDEAGSKAFKVMEANTPANMPYKGIVLSVTPAPTNQPDFPDAA